MPVTIFPSPSKVGHNQKPVVTSSQGLLKATSSGLTTIRQPRGSTDKEGEWVIAMPDDRPILGSSFNDIISAPVVPIYGNALVQGILSAFQQDLHLVIRPDDIWLAILTQFNFYVNASTKMLPQPFATFMGKKQLYQMSSLITCDDLFGHVDSIQGLMEYFPRGQAAQMLIENLEQIVEDPGLREWMLPNFSTTTLDDKAIASTVMMSTFQKHVEYSACGPRAFCGFPSVTVLGQPKDWQLILDRIQKLPRYGEQVEAWSKLLTCILNRIIATFSVPWNSQDTRDFWLMACYTDGRGGSEVGRRYLSGWLTAFCFWTEEGQPLDCALYPEGARIGIEVVNLKDKRAVTDLAGIGVKPLESDGVRFPLVYLGNGVEGSIGYCTRVPRTVVAVPVTLKEFDMNLMGDMKITGGMRVERRVTVVAGHVGMTLGNAGNGQMSYQPRSGWWVLEDSSEVMEV